MSTTPIFDELAAGSDVVCPICGRVDIHGLTGGNERGADLDVCIRCWERGFQWPEVRGNYTCVDCGKLCLEPFDAMVLVVGADVIHLCSADYERRVNA